MSSTRCFRGHCIIWPTFETQQEQTCVNMREKLYLEHNMSFTERERVYKEVLKALLGINTECESKGSLEYCASHTEGEPLVEDTLN